MTTTIRIGERMRYLMIHGWTWTGPTAQKFSDTAGK